MKQRRKSVKASRPHCPSPQQYKSIEIPIPKNGCFLFGGLFLFWRASKKENILKKN
jgi:hypothetical protein